MGTKSYDLHETIDGIKKKIITTPNNELFDTLWKIGIEPEYRDFFSTALCHILPEYILYARMMEVRYERLKQYLESALAICEEKAMQK